MKILGLLVALFAFSPSLVANTCPEGQQEVCHNEAQYRCETVSQWRCDMVTVVDPITGETRVENQCGYKDVEECTLRPTEVCQCVAATPTDPGGATPVSYQCSACTEQGRQFCGYYQWATSTWQSGDYRVCSR